MRSKRTRKYEIAIGVPKDEFKNGRMTDYRTSMIDLWQAYAETFYDETGVYVSAIALNGESIYNHDWGCPFHGEHVLVFHCTANPEFVKDLEKYEEGILYITKKIKTICLEHTVTITHFDTDITYLTDEDNTEEL